MNNYTIYKMTNQVKSLGKTLLDNSGITEWLGGKINIKDKSIPVYIDKTDWNNFKAELDALEKDPVQVDLYLKAHGLEQVEGLKDYILNNDIKQNSVNELITQQNYTNIAKQASGFKGVNQAIDAYNASLQKNSDDTIEATANTEKLVNAISTTNTSLGKYLTGLNGAKAGLDSYAGFLVTATARTIALEAATMAMNTVVSLGVSFLVSTVISAIVSWADNVIHATEKIKEAAEEAKSAIDDIKSEFDSLKSTTDNVKERFAELAQGVENLGKRNQSRGTLSTDDYNEFLDLSNQLAELFPQLTKGYDDNGNAILDLSGNVDTIVGSLDNLVSVQQKLANQQILENMPDVWAGYTTNLDEYTEELEKSEKNVESYQAALNELSNMSGDTKIKVTSSSVQQSLINAARNIGLDDGDWFGNSLSALYSENRSYSGKGLSKFKSAEWDFSSLTESQINQLKNELGSIASEYKGIVELTEGKIETANSEMSSYINTWLSTDAGAKWNYGQMDSDMQNLVEDVLINSDWVSQLPNEVDAGDWDDVSDWLQQEFLYAINTIDSEEIHDSLIDAFNNSLSVEELQELINQLTETEGFNEDSPLIVYLDTKLKDAEEFQEQYEEAIEKYGEEGKAVLEKFFKENSIDSSDKIDYWNEVTEGAKSAEESIEMYNEAIAEAAKASIISFSEAFNSSDFADAKKELLELAKSGEITAATLESTEEYQTLLDETGLSAEAATNNILDMLSAQEKLAAASNGLDQLKSAYEEFQDLGFVTAASLEDLPDVFKGLDGFDLFSEIVGNPAQGTEKIQQAFNEIVKQYLISQDTLSGLINASESEIQSYIANLKQMGITNAEELISQTTGILNQENTLINEAEEEYFNTYLKYLESKDDADLEYLENTTSKNGQLAQLLGSTYESDYKNWCELLSEKALAYNRFLNEIGGSYNPDIGIAQNLLANGITPTTETISQAYSLLAEYQALQRETDTIKDELKLDFSSINTDFSTSFSPYYDTTSESGSAQTFDWIETALSRTDEALSRLDQKISDTYSSWTERNKSLAQSMEKTKEAISLQEQAYSSYIKEADAIGLSDTYKRLVQNGTLRIEDITDSSLADKISEYQDLYAKAISCLDTAQELKQTLNEISTSDKWNNIKTESDAVITSFDSDINSLQTKIDQLELKGLFADSAYYADMASLTQKKISTLTSEASQLQSILNTMTSGTEAYDTMFSELMDIRQEIAELENDCIEFNNTIRSLDWEIFEYLEEAINRITDETEYLTGLLENKDMYDDDGSLTKYADAAIALHAAAYDTYRQQAQDYYDEVQDLQRQLINGAGQEVLEQYNEMAEAHRDAVNAAEDEKEAILDLIENGYDAQLDAIQELIDRKKEALSAEKDLYSYQKSISEQTANISSLEKQKLAYENDTSEEAMSKIQQIKVELEEAKADLQETEYEQYLSDTEDMLDQLAEAYENWMNDRLDNSDALLAEIVSAVAGKGDQINATLNEVAEEYGTFISDTITSVFDSASPFTNALTNGLNTVSTTIAGTTAAIDKLVSYVAGLTNAGAGKTNAGSGTAGSSSSGTSSSTKTAGSGNSGSTKTSIASGSLQLSAKTNSSSNNSSNSSNPSWGSWFIKKTDTYPKDKLNKDTSIVDRLKYNNLDSSFSARAQYYSAMGGSGTYTGSAAQNIWMLSQMKSHGYRSGTSNAPGGYHWTQEDGTEFILRKSDGAILTPLGKGDMVFTNEMSKRLWEMAQGNFAPGISMPDFTSSLDNIPLPANSSGNGDSIMNVGDVSVILPNITNYEDFRNALIKDNTFEKAMFTSINHAITGKGTSLDKMKYTR